MSDGVLTRAIADLERAGIPLAAVLDPARRDDILRTPGIGRKAYARLREAANNGQTKSSSTAVDRALALLRNEWHAGSSGLPGFHHQPQALSRSQVAAALGIDSEGLDP